MKLFSIITLFVAAAVAQNGRVCPQIASERCIPIAELLIRPVNLLDVNALVAITTLLEYHFANENSPHSCGFPDGPDCVSLGNGVNGLEQFVDDPCCLLPLRCGNIAGERCERVAAGSSNNNAGNRQRRRRRSN